jgi:hypothetical protein
VSTNHLVSQCTIRCVTHTTGSGALKLLYSNKCLGATQLAKREEPWAHGELLLHPRFSLRVIYAPSTLCALHGAAE